MSDARQVLPAQSRCTPRVGVRHRGGAGQPSRPTSHLPLPKGPAALTPVPQAKSCYWQCLCTPWLPPVGTWLAHRLPGTLSLPPPGRSCLPSSSGGLSAPEPVHQDRSPREANVLHSSLPLGVAHPSPCQRRAVSVTPAAVKALEHHLYLAHGCGHRIQDRPKEYGDSPKTKNGTGL